MRSNILGVVALAMIAGAGSANAANLILNGSFESGVNGQIANGSGGLTSWVVDGPSGEIYRQPNGTNGVVSQDGSYNIDLTGICDTRCPGGAYGGISQSIATDIGATYQLVFYGGNWATQNMAAGLSASAAGVSQTFAIPQTNLAYDWTRFTLDFTAVDAITKVSFVGTAGTTFVGLDNVSVEYLSDAPSPAPEPATWALMILGLGATGTALRRRRGLTAGSLFNALR